ncbi:MAG: SIMPL domain-containing protein [Acidimicrobiales bacterium]
MNEDRDNDRQPGSGGPAQESPNAGLQATVADANVATSRKLGHSFTARALGVVGVTALVVVGSILGAAALSGASSSARPTNLKTVLTASHDASTTSPATITVTGTGEVEGTPDTAIFDIGVTTTARTAVEALGQNNTQVATLEQSLEQNGVLLKNMQTSSLNLSANTNSKGKVKNFTADDELTVTMTNLANLGAAIDAAVTATGNGVTLDGISFSISNQSALLAAARAQAMQAAHTEATQVAAGGGLVLGPIVSITDQENAGQYVYYNQSAPVASGAAVPVQPGQQQISVQVTVVYQLVASS